VRAVAVTAVGGPEVLELRELPSPEPGERQLLVDVAAAGVNFRDVYERRAAGYGPGEPPFVAGIEGAGTVAAVGPGVTELAVGDRVAWVAAFGSYAEQVVVDEAKAVPLPDGVDEETAAAVLLQGMTAHYLTHSTYAVQPGDWVLNHAAAGGVGLLITQIVKNVIGGRVVGTTGAAAKAQLAREAGADEVLRYDEVPDRVLELTGGRGVPVAYDGVGATTFDGSLRSLAPRGMGVLYGAASGQPEPIAVGKLAARAVFVTRPGLVHYTATRAELLGRAADVLGWVRDGKLTVRVGGRYALEQARQAQEDIESRRTTGKLLLTVR
jgi:NADPH2:quinone reductase